MLRNDIEWKYSQVSPFWIELLVKKHADTIMVSYMYKLYITIMTKFARKDKK